MYWYRKAADQGLAQAQNNLGLCYYNGEGVPKDFKQAVYWWKKAADQGYAIAQFNLGNRYAYGEGVPNDFKQAVYWYRKAADQGLAEAQFNLGFCYENGVGVAKNLVEALKWYRKAADQGKAKAKTRAERIEAELKAEAARKQLRAQLEASGFEASGFEALPLPQGIKLEMVKIPAGSFQRVGLTVTLSKPFWLGKYEVTQAQWKAVMGNNPSRFKGDNLPVEQVSLVDAKKFCIKLNEIYADKLPSGYQFDLPTEAQWEYACRAGTTTDLNNGKNLTSNWEECSNLNEVAWYIKNTRITTSEVGQKRANAWGLYDMHGNVWEWCRDRYGDYPGRAVTDPVGPSFGSNHVIRGGSWYDFADICRSDCRGSRGPLIRSDSGGFRLALVPIQ